MRATPENPTSGPEAFTDNSDEGALAQAAILLGIGSQLRGDRQKIEARSAAVAQPTDFMMSDELDDFEIPRLAPASKRVSTAVVEERAFRRFGVRRRAVGESPDQLAAMADDVFQSR